MLRVPERVCEPDVLAKKRPEAFRVLFQQLYESSAKHPNIGEVDGMRRDCLADNIELKTSACYRCGIRNACAGIEWCNLGGQAWSMW